MNNYQALLLNASYRQEIADALPLVRNMMYSRIRNIVADGTLKPQSEFNRYPQKNVIYFYYGRQAHKFSDRVPDDGTKSKWHIVHAEGGSVVFILKADQIEGVVAVYPFDSGGFLAGYYDQWLSGNHNNKALDCYVLGEDVLCAQKFVELLYGVNENYMTLTLNNRFPDISEYNNLVDYASIQGKNEIIDYPDDRAATIEVNVDSAVSLAVSLEAIIIPEIKKGSPEIRKLKQICSNSKVKVITHSTTAPYELAPYNTNQSIYQQNMLTPPNGKVHHPNEHNTVLNSLVTKYFREKMYI